MKVILWKTMNYLEKQNQKKSENLLKYHQKNPELSQRKLALIFHMTLPKVNQVIKKSMIGKK